MDRQNGQGTEAATDALYRLLEELDRLEDLIEEMDELGVATRAEAEHRMAELNRRVDGLPDGE
jgi:hypothetical protein